MDHGAASLSHAQPLWTQIAPSPPTASAPPPNYLPSHPHAAFTYCTQFLVSCRPRTGIRLAVGGCCRVSKLLRLFSSNASKLLSLELWWESACLLDDRATAEAASA